MNIKFKTVTLWYFPLLMWNETMPSNRATHMIVFQHWNAEQFSRKKTQSRAGLWAASSWALQKTLTVGLLTAFSSEVAADFRCCIQKIKASLNLGFWWVCGRPFEFFFPEDSSSNTPAGMGIGPLLTHAVICCPLIEEEDGKYCSSQQAAGRQTRASLLNCQGFQPEEWGASWQSCRWFGMIFALICLQKLRCCESRDGLQEGPF